MLPLVIDEGSISPFKFWFEDSIQEGMYCRGELYYRLHSADLKLRARVYHYACKMAIRETVVVTATDMNCSIWVSLRSQSLKPIAQRYQPLPSFMEFISDRSLSAGS
ncbi:hypothetical protein ACQ4M4_16330 [Leptolyngbya sp. AN02str]|uniref:hypothetical protein n=1 Tax=Leptolyngbya sp. AN02str TaxID=3423363 RepID=UPI003D3206FB